MKNNKLLKALSILSVSVLSLGMFAGCGTSNSTSEATSNEVDTNQEEVKDNNTNVKDDNVIIMGTNAEFEPFEYREDGMDIVGFDVEIAEKVAEKKRVIDKQLVSG